MPRGGGRARACPAVSCHDLRHRLVTRFDLPVVINGQIQAPAIHLRNRGLVAAVLARSRMGADR